MFLLGCILDMWRVATIQLVFEKGLRAATANYRPLSLTCVVCKKWRLFDVISCSHLVCNNLLTSSRQGVRNKHLSTGTCSLILLLVSIPSLF